MIAVAGGIVLAVVFLSFLGFCISMLDSGPSWDISGTDIAIAIVAVLMMLAAVVTS